MLWTLLNVDIHFVLPLHHKTHIGTDCTPETLATVKAHVKVRHEHLNTHVRNSLVFRRDELAGRAQDAQTGHGRCVAPSPVNRPPRVPTRLGFLRSFLRLLPFRLLPRDPRRLDFLRFS